MLRSVPRLPPLCILALLAGLSFVFPAAAAAPLGDPDPEEGDLTELSIEDLLGIEVTIASRASQKISEVPGAVYVLTGDEIRRAGHSSVQEALRMVPGFYISRWQTSNWDVTSRGFGPGLAYSNEAYVNQLLVLLDGVVVYSPLFPGVWWALQDLDMGQVDRIEIIRGPGGILWGANAVHGVVHVITKDARDTLGPRISARVSEDERHVAASSGIPLGEDGALRLWLKGARYDALIQPPGAFDDSYGIDSIGGRADWTASDGAEWSIWSRAYNADLYEVGFDLVDFVPFRALSEKHGFQASVERYQPESGTTWSVAYTSDQQRRPTFFDFRIDTLDVELRRELYRGDQLDVQGGFQWFHVQSDFVGDDPPFWDFDPSKVSLDTLRGFALATYAFDDPTWNLVGGVSVEHNDLTEWEVQPTLRLSWAPDDASLAWASVSRAVRTPSLEERFSATDSFLAGNPDFDSEEVVAFELGYREAVSETLSADLALFFNEYDDLRVELFDPVNFVQFPANEGEATTYGAELALDWKPSERWSVRSSYAFEKGEFEFKPTGADLGTDQQAPRHSGSLRSYYDLSEEWTLDLGLYAVEDLGDFIREAEYVRTDVRLGYTPNSSLSAYLGAQGFNLNDWTEFSELNGERRTSLFFGFDWTP